MTSFERTGSFPRRRNAMLPPVLAAAPAAAGGPTVNSDGESEEEETSMINQSMIMCFEQAVGSFQYQEALAPLVPGQSMALWRWRTCKLRLWSRYYAVQFLVRTLQCFRESVSNVRDALRMAVGVRTAPQQLVLQRWLERVHFAHIGAVDDVREQLSKVPAAQFPARNSAPRSARNSPDAPLLL